MKMIVFFSLLYASISFASEVRFKDGTVEFAVAEINGIKAWNQEEKDRLVSTFQQFESTSPFSVVDLTPSNYEVTLATSGIKFVNASDYRECVKNNQKAKDKIDDLKPSEIRQNSRTIDALKSYLSK